MNGKKEYIKWKAILKENKLVLFSLVKVIFFFSSAPAINDNFELFVSLALFLW